MTHEQLMQYAPYAGLIGLVLAVAAVVGLAICSARLRRLRSTLAEALGESGAATIEETLLKHTSAVAELRADLSRLQREHTQLGERASRAISHVGLIHYDAFDDVGGQQSYSAVLLDDHRDGVAITSIFSRTSVRVYAKRIEAGQSAQPLSDEEDAALRQAGGK
ncbi:MAG: DUF4446 family protein [Armatimonadetes bacterium]|nr:DUF4446 family protein [Armatimonadota bacterium]